MIEALTLIIGFGLGFLTHRCLTKIMYLYKFGDWTISMWKGENDQLYMWAVSEKKDLTVVLDSDKLSYLSYDDGK